MASPYAPYAVVQAYNSNGFSLFGACLNSAATGVAGFAMLQAMNAYFAQFPNNSIPINIVDTVTFPGSTFTSSYYTTICNGNKFLSNAASLFLTLGMQRQTLAAQRIDEYLRGDAGSPSTLFAWDISYNYINPTSMSINSIGLIYDNN